MANAVQTGNPDRAPTVSRRGAIDRYYCWMSRLYGVHEGWFERTLRETALEMLSPRVGERILDIGCGTGYALSDLARRAGPSASVHGLDGSWAMIQRARVRTRDREASVHVSRADARALPYRTQSFDAVYSSGVLELYDAGTRVDILSEAKRVVRTSGRIVLATMHDDGRASWALGLYEWLREVLPGMIPCRPVNGGELASRVGLTVVRTEPVRLKGLVPIEVLLLTPPGAPCTIR